MPAVVPAAPAPIAGTDWTGFYAGAQIEYGDVGVSGAATDDGTGALGGVFAGYRYDFGSYVIGAELDLNLPPISTCPPLSARSTASPPRRGGRFRRGPRADLRHRRCGLRDGGYRRADADGNGYFYGVGVDYAVTDQVVLGAELLRHEFDDFDGTGLDVGATTVGVSAALRF
jgi:outer membrane immunogenic protein